METYKIKFESTRYDGNSSSMGTPMQDCMSGVGLKNPDDLVFMDWLNGGNLEVHLVVTVRVLSFPSTRATELNYSIS
jgi:hypothetical protein